jgi:predicted dienelactone hydrolase
MTIRTLARTARAGLALTLAAGAIVSAPSVADAQIGGGYTTETVRSASGFGGGTIYAPRSGNNLPVIALSPGYTERQSAVSWYGPLFANAGFVVITIDTNSTLDQPAARGRQLNAALDHVVTRSGVSNRVDRNRLGAGGHSMGGGGSLSAAASNSRILATLPLAPWHGTKSWSQLSAASLIVAAQNDSVAPTSSHARRFYDSMRSPKIYMELSRASHNVTNRSNSAISARAVPFMNRYLKGDQSAESALCSAPSGTSRYDVSGLCGGGSGGGGTGGGGTGGGGTGGGSWWNWWS